jgi:hypothetical protein
MQQKSEAHQKDSKNFISYFLKDILIALKILEKMN